MPIISNIDGFIDAFNEAPKEFRDEVLRPLARTTIPAHFARISTEEYMQSGPATFGGPPPPRPPGLDGPLRRVSNRLRNAVQGTFKRGSREGKSTFDIDERGLIWTASIDVPYARIHELGGEITVHNTAALESIFWAKMFDAIDHQLPFVGWKRLALAVKGKSTWNVTIPPRPYLNPAMEDTVPIVVERGETLIMEFMDKHLPG
jgi:phage gpG-like protein